MANTGRKRKPSLEFIEKMKGNQRAKGNKGGGRKSAYHEHQMAQKLIDSFQNPVDIQALVCKYESGHISLFDFSILRAFQKDAVLINLINKVLPDKVQLTPDEESSGKIAQLTATTSRILKDFGNIGKQFQIKLNDSKNQGN